MSRGQILHQVSALADAAAELAGFEELSEAEVVQSAAELTRAHRLIEARLVAITARLDGVDTARTTGWATAKDLLTHLTGGHKGAGGSYVRLAEGLRDLPSVRDALAVGTVSLAQARVIATRVNALPRDDAFRAAVAEALLDRVRHQQLDATDLDRAVPQVVRELDPDGRLIGAERDKARAERGAHFGRFLTLSPDRFGGVHLKGYGTLEEAELIKATLMPLAAPVTTQAGTCGGDPTLQGRRDADGRRLDPSCPTPGCDHSGRDTRDHGVRMWDALVEACRRLQGADRLPHDHATAARITVTATLDDLRDGAVDAGVLASGDTITATALRRLACDADVIPAVLGAQGQALDVGRAQRLVTAGIWTALVLRDRHCTFPGCQRLPLACDAHHIVHWADGGPTSLDNLALLCRRHHTLTHTSPWTIELDPHTRRPVWHPPPPVDDMANFIYLPAA